MPDETRYHIVITPRVPLYAYSYGRKGEGFEIFCDPIVAFAFYYDDGMNINLPLTIGYDALEDHTEWGTYLGMSTVPDIPFEQWKEDILRNEGMLERKREQARRNGSGKDIQP